MGFETKVLNHIAEVDLTVSRFAYFYNGTLWIETNPFVTTGDVYDVVESLKSIVTCEMQTSRVGDEIAIDFV